MSDNRPPWIKFDLDDFCDDQNLKLCPLDTQGWYVHLMKVLSRAESYGYLLINGSQHTSNLLHTLTGYPTKTCAKHTQILKMVGVLKKDETGWYSKRMVEDWLEYQQSREYGLKGAEAKKKKQDSRPPSKPPLEGTLQPLEEEEEIEEEGDFPPKILELTAILRSLILQRKPDRKLATSWAKNTASAIDRMIRLDGRNLKQVRRVIEWSQDNDFWWKNILSGEKLREKFDQMEADMGTESTPNPDLPVDDLGRTMVPLNGKNYTQKQVDEMIAVGKVQRTKEGYCLAPPTTPEENVKAKRAREWAERIASERGVS